MIKNLKSLRQNQPEPMAKVTNNINRRNIPNNRFGESSEEMDFDDWSQNHDMKLSNQRLTNVQKGFYQNKFQNPSTQFQNQARNNNQEYYDAKFEESDEIEEHNMMVNKRGANQHIQQQIGKVHRQPQRQESSDLDFDNSDDNEDFDDGTSNGQDDDFEDVKLNVRRFKSSAKKNFTKEDKKQDFVHEFTENSEFNFEENQSISKINAGPVNRNLKKELTTDKKSITKVNNSNVHMRGKTTKIPSNGGNSKNPPKSS